ncbi:DUF418 domain-containing protein [Saccharibacillus sp. CPCC 101409]|uniref:DUF418 domain-containing protein n=1 Tax=Saccharibacillus sp. CPCC 101409 TaxID=3058041 RepID=UPI0026719F42|nr:DUF418 domain-containing protein [Saccharibacillus sp. CPCC 101409]MDO3411939.1 DUF418 domain-containing protein [Saccharibacillus sp. CPCC 101409]
MPLFDSSSAPAESGELHTAQRPQPQQTGRDPGRIRVLDQMRGIALLAIFLCNLPGLTGRQYGEGLTLIGDTTLGNELHSLVRLFFGNSSRPLFAFMFGISMLLIYDSRRRSGRSPQWTLLRRMLMLLLIGAAHLYGVWEGDILFMYALDGLLLLLFVRLPAPVLTALGLLGFALVPQIAQMLLPHIGGVVLDPGYWIFAGLGRIIDPEVLFAQPHLVEALGELALALEHLPFFLLGMAAYRGGLFAGLPRHPAIGWTTSLLLLLAGLLGKGLYVNAYFGDTQSVIYQFACFAVTLGAAMAIILIGNGPGKRLLEPFTAAGRMAFSNYLFQSLVFVSIFSQSGRTIFSAFGWIDPLPYSVLLPAAVLFFALQMALSHLWLRRFRYGPFEWLWRIGTNLELPAIRRTDAGRTVAERPDIGGTV